MRYASIKENKFLHVAISVAISVASLWILVRVSIRFRGVLRRLDRRDRRCPSENQGGFARTASSHREIPLARRKPRRFLLHFRHFFHREPLVPNHFSRDPQDATLIAADENWKFRTKRFFKETLLSRR